MGTGRMGMSAGCRAQVADVVVGVGQRWPAWLWVQGLYSLGAGGRG